VKRGELRERMSKYSEKRRCKHMAWIKSEKRWVDREERQEMINTLEEYLELVDIDNATPEELEEVAKMMDELARLKRVHRAEEDLLYFSWEYFSEKGNPGNPGNWEGFDLECPEDAAEFHKEICHDMDEVSNKKKNAKIVRAAPRGHAKSTYLSKAFPIREVCFRKRKFIIAISITPDIAMKNIEWISLQLKHNKKLREDFGPLLNPKKQENPRDNSESFIAWHEDKNGEQKLLTLVEASSTGKALRGKNWNGSRPDLIVCDDLEDLKENAGTQEQREKLKDWFNSVVLPLGDPKGKRTAIVLMGTTVHHDCLLMDLLYRRGDFEPKVYRSIIKEPERLDLWELCRKIYQDHENPNRLNDAKEFYKKHKEEMDKGAILLWPESKDLWTLYQIKWDLGTKAFNTEYQNNPIDEDSMIFNPKSFTYWDNKDPGKTFKHSQYHIGFGIDFAMGKERGDFSAISVVARNKETGVIYVVDSYVERIHPDKFLDVIVERVLKWQPDVIAVEAQHAQEFFSFHLKQKLQAVGYPAHTRVKEVKQKARKELRIEALLPDIQSGKIQFNTRHHRLLEQFELYGTNSHDDAPDSLEMAITAVRQSVPVVIEDKPFWM
jgi:predicted phage terminase large subunit-like protein